MFEGPNNPIDNKKKMDAIFTDGEDVKTGKMVDGKEIWDESFTEEDLVKQIQEARTLGDRSKEQELLKRLQIFDKKKEEDSREKTEEIDSELIGEYEMADRQEKGEEREAKNWDKSSSKKEEKAEEKKEDSEDDKKAETDSKKEEKKTTEENPSGKKKESESKKESGADETKERERAEAEKATMEEGMDDAFRRSSESGYEFLNEDERKRVAEIDRLIKEYEKDIENSESKLGVERNGSENNLKDKIRERIARLRENIDGLREERENIFKNARMRAEAGEAAGAEGAEKQKPGQENLSPEEREAQLMARFELLDNELHGRPIRDKDGKVIGREAGLMKEYVRCDNEMDKKASIMKKFFGFGKRNQLGKYNEEYEQAKANYEGKMKEYKSVMLELMGDRDGAEITSNWIEKGEYLNLKNARIDVKTENCPWSEKIKKCALKFAEDYRKLPLWKKMVMGGTLAGVGFAGGAVGGAVAVGSAAFLTGMRIFSTGVSAVGFKGLYEGIAEKSRGKKAEAGTKENMLWGASGPGPEGSFDLSRINGILDQKIGRMDGELQSRKDWSKRRTWMAVGSALTMTAIGNYVGHKFSDYLKGGVSGAGEIQPGINHLPDNLSTINIPEGSSFEGALGKHLQLMGMSAEEAGKKAHLMALDYAQEHGLENGPYSLVHEGAKIQLSSDGTKVLNITDVKGLGWLASRDVIGAGNPSMNESQLGALEDYYGYDRNGGTIGATEVPKPPVEDVVNQAETPKPPIEDIANQSEIPEVYPQPEVEGSDYVGTIIRIQDDINSQIVSNQEELTRSYTHSPEELANITERIEMLNNRGGFLNNLQEAINGNITVANGTQAETVKAVILQSIAGDRDGLPDVMRLSFNDDYVFNSLSPNGSPLVSGLDWRTEDRLQAAVTYLREIGGEKAVPRPGESLRSWVERAANILSK